MSAYVVAELDVHLLIEVALKGARDAENTWINDHPLRWNVGAGGAYRELTYESRHEVGQMLLDECVRSVRSRYPSDSLDELPGTIDQPWRRGEPYEHVLRGYRMTCVEALKAISHYEYQSCEHAGWAASQAAAFCAALRSRLVGQLPGTNAAPWGWTDELLVAAEARG